jgi:hypothetical protein
MKQLWVAFAAVALVLLASRPAHARGCSEVSDIVGYEHCNRFGDGWAVDRRFPLFLGFGLQHSLFDPNGLTFQQETGKGVALANDASLPHFDGGSLGVGGLESFGFDVRVGGYFLGPLYTGVDFGWGFGHNDMAVVSSNGTTFTPSRSSFNTSENTFGSLLGIRLPLGRLSLRLEELAALRTEEISEETPTGEMRMGAFRGVLETRALVDVWATPNVTLSVFGGTNALDTNEHSAGLTLEYHGRSFDGAFALW